jgi:tRNA pseudouridine32 synthase/23S rRNA pseudouridine746 synthase
MSTDLPLIPILYLDASLLVINKPAGLPSLPDGYDTGAPHVRKLLEPHLGRVWIVHRLDRGTSGVLLLARSAEIHQALNSQFEKRQVSKIYHALVHGCPKWDSKTVEARLRVDVGHKHRTVIDQSRGKPAVTHLRVLERFAAYALVEAVPETGRTHQIRAHLAALGHPLLADELYGSYLKKNAAVQEADPITNPAHKQALMPRLGLHAWKLSIEHPVQHTVLHFEAPYPEDFTQALEHLRQAGGFEI